MLSRGNGAREVEEIYTRARELCRRIGETPHLFSVLFGLRRFYLAQGKFQTARELGEQLLTLAQNLRDTDLLARAHLLHGEDLHFLGEFSQAREHAEQGVALYDSQQHYSHSFLYGTDTGVSGLSLTASVLWVLGYPDKALQKSREALSLAQKLSHPASLAQGLALAAWFRLSRREGQVA